MSETKNLKQMIEARIENYHTEEILAALKPFIGKLPSKRMASTLESKGFSANVIKCKFLGTYTIEIWKTHYDTRMSLYLAPVNTAYNEELFVSRNPAYFAGAQERNEARRALLADDSKLAELESAINAVNAANASYAKLRETLPDKYDFDNLIKNF